MSDVCTGKGEKEGRDLVHYGRRRMFVECVASCDGWIWVSGF